MGDSAIRVSGASHLDLKDLEMRNVDIKLTGASQCLINVSGKLDSDVAGASKLTYRGNPITGNIKSV